MKETNKLLPFIWKYLKNRKKYLVILGLISLVSAAEMSVSPYLLKLIIDKAANHFQNKARLLTEILIPAVLYVIAYIILNLTFRLWDYINLKLHPEMKSAITKELFTHLLSHSNTFFQNNFPGSLTKKISDLANNIELLFSFINGTFITFVLALMISSITLFNVVHPLFGVILFSWALIFIYLSYATAKKSEKFAALLSENTSKVDGIISDSISNIMNVKLFSSAPHEVNHVSYHTAKLVDSERKLQWQNLKINFIQGLGVTTLDTFMLLALIYCLIHDWVSPGDFALVLILSNSFLRKVRDIGQQILRLSKIIGICNHTINSINIPCEIIDIPNSSFLIVKNGKIEFKNISFQYENNKPIFNNLNIKINAGEKVGLVGYSGSGKSTFIKLILRLIEPQTGEILIDAQDIKKVTQNSLRQQIGTIPQHPELFHRTIMENIRFSKTNANDEDVVFSAIRARCHEFISELPQKYHSLVGERGIKLSGGQKQRIAIARIFLKQAPILLLDEATSALDSITEHAIQKSLDELMVNKTTIIIAHRLSTLKNMDRILVFKDGRIVEDGSLDYLLKNREGDFYKLWHMQSQGILPIEKPNKQNIACI